MLPITGSAESRLKFLERKGHQYESIVEWTPARAEIKVNGFEVKYMIGLYNFWAWVSPISPWTQYIAFHGGYHNATNTFRR